MVPIMEVEVADNVAVGRLEERECARRVCARESAQERELSDYTSQGREKIHKNIFRVSLPRYRAVRS